MAGLLANIKRPEARPTVATGSQIEALLRTAPTWQKLFITLAWQMGLRFAEILRVTPASHRWDDERQHGWVTIQRKGGKVSTLPTTPDIEALIAAAGDTTGREEVPYILIHKGRHASTHSLRCSWWRLCKQAGVENLHPHDLRRTVLTALYNVTKDLRAVQQFAGHESLASTTAYLAPLTQEELREYHRLLNFHAGGRPN